MGMWEKSLSKSRLWRVQRAECSLEDAYGNESFLRNIKLWVIKPFASQLFFFTMLASNDNCYGEGCSAVLFLLTVINLVESKTWLDQSISELKNHGNLGGKSKIEIFCGALSLSSWQIPQNMTWNDPPADPSELSSWGEVWQTHWQSVQQINQIIVHLKKWNLYIQAFWEHHVLII